MFAPVLFTLTMTSALVANSSSLVAVSVSADDTNDPRYIVPAGQYSGVVLLEIGEDEVCTGSLLPSDRHILTAAHCFEQNREGSDRPTRNPDPNDVTVTFQLKEEDVVMDVSRIIMHPDWRNDEANNGDLAILELVDIAPEGAEPYELYRDRDEVGKVFTRVGFGTSSTGKDGEDEDDEDSIMRFGKNRYEALGDIFNEAGEAEVIPQSQLVYDFDSGRDQNDALGVEFGLSDLGLGWQEIGSSGGDSGGPAFIDGKIAGLSSSGMSPDVDGVDVTEENDTSFGEFFFDTRISFYADYIDGVIAGEVGAAGETVGDETSTDNLSSERASPWIWMLGLPLGVGAIGWGIWAKTR